MINILFFIMFVMVLLYLKNMYEDFFSYKRKCSNCLSEEEARVFCNSIEDIKNSKNIVSKNKFKIWHKKWKVMSEPCEIWRIADCFVDISRKANKHNEDINIEDVVFLQCVGLTDKNDEEIYEADIIKRIAYLRGGEEEVNFFVVKYHEPFACFSFENSIDGIATYKEASWIAFTFEVLGNKFENPELLKKVKGGL